MDRDHDDLLLDTPRHFSFDQIHGYLSRSSNECLFRTAGGSVTRCIPVEKEKPIVTIGSEEDGRLRIRIDGVDSSRLPAVRGPLVRYIAEWFDLDTDLSPFYDMASRDPLLRDPAERYSGLRLVGVPDLFEAIGWAILGQQINLTFAYTLKRRLVESFGQHAADADGARHWIFPTAERIAGLRTEDLTPLQMTVKKAEYLIETAALIANGSLTKDRLLEAGNVAEAERILTAVRGIGPWTAHYVAMRCLRYPSAFPIADVGLHLAIQRLLGTDRKPTIAEIKRLSSSWSGWESYATFYLWKVLY
ncbi:DNA-3-methyladenine glycosylase [Cohnella sp. CFH 77786]|uniref:DNA-3-methyladenine glycosylase family protein n=1 Tax=Cohnella sp. CFH 77786 TaxID=2662265 RepID=UPI001C60F038|nr:DNA-3-methyladenine glycosylase [Cohnella sp. CFH 77786]MBW5446243.1 DNA-3-methyladenine glycosylase [Cohnella sp. CFH 77786]